MNHFSHSFPNKASPQEFRDAASRLADASTKSVSEILATQHKVAKIVEKMKSITNEKK